MVRSPVIMTGLLCFSRRARIWVICIGLDSAWRAVRAVLSWAILSEVRRKELTRCFSIGRAFRAERTEVRSASVIGPNSATMGVG